MWWRSLVVARYYLLVPYRLGRCDATGLPGGEQGSQERGQQGDADDEPQFSPGNAIDQARVKLLEEVDCKDVVCEDQAEHNPQDTAYGPYQERFKEEGSLDKPLVAAEGAQHADLLAAFDHRAGTRNGQRGNAKQED